MKATMFTGLMVGKATSSITGIRKGSFVSDVASTAAGAVTEVTVTVAGLTTADVVILNPPAGLEAGLSVTGARVTAANTLKFRVHNTTAGVIDPASATYTYTAFRS